MYKKKEIDKVINYIYRRNRINRKKKNVYKMCKSRKKNKSMM